MAISDPALSRLIESDTFTCSHCNRVERLSNDDGSRRVDVAVRCHGCDALTCVPCAETGRCAPFEKKLEAMEAGDRLLAAARS
jgi:hypothetical protein